MCSAKNFTCEWRELSTANESAAIREMLAFWPDNDTHNADTEPDIVDVEQFWPGNPDSSRAAGGEPEPDPEPESEPEPDPEPEPEMGQQRDQDWEQEWEPGPDPQPELGAFRRTNATTAGPHTEQVRPRDDPRSSPQSPLDPHQSLSSAGEKAPAAPPPTSTHDDVSRSQCLRTEVSVAILTALCTGL